MLNYSYSLVEIIGIALCTFAGYAFCGIAGAVCGFIGSAWFASKLGY